jgi:hypothetical protein
VIFIQPSRTNALHNGTVAAGEIAVTVALVYLFAHLISQVKPMIAALALHHHPGGVT